MSRKSLKPVILQIVRRFPGPSRPSETEPPPKKFRAFVLPYLARSDVGKVKKRKPQKRCGDDRNGDDVVRYKRSPFVAVVESEMPLCRSCYFPLNVFSFNVVLVVVVVIAVVSFRLILMLSVFDDVPTALSPAGPPPMVRSVWGMVVHRSRRRTRTMVVSSVPCLVTLLFLVMVMVDGRWQHGRRRGRHCVRGEEDRQLGRAICWALGAGRRRR